MHWVACFFSKSAYFFSKSAYFHALLVAQSSARLAIKHFSHKVSPPKILPTSGESCSFCQQEKSSTYMCMCVFTLGRQLSMRHRFFFFLIGGTQKEKEVRNNATPFPSLPNSDSLLLSFQLSYWATRRIICDNKATCSFFLLLFFRVQSHPSLHI